MNDLLRFRRALEFALQDFDAIEVLCQAKINLVAEVLRLRDISLVAMSASGYIQACRDLLDLPEDRIQRLSLSLNQTRMARREALLKAYLGEDLEPVTLELEIAIDWWNGMSLIEQQEWLSRTASTRPSGAREVFMADLHQRCLRWERGPLASV